VPDDDVLNANPVSGETPANLPNQRDRDWLRAALDGILNPGVLA